MSARALKIALAAWESGRTASGFGARVGGLGVVVEQLPAELMRAAARRGLPLAVQTVSPCFAWYDRGALERVGPELPVSLGGRGYAFEAYRRLVTEQVELDEGLREITLEMIYLWNPELLGDTSPGTIYPEDAWLGARLYAAVSQAMAGWLARHPPDTVHLHDYHVGLIPHFLPPAFVESVPCHLTIHNGSYQGEAPLQGGGYETLDALGLPGAQLFHRYFDHGHRLNLLKAAMLRVHELGGRITTVSGDLEGSWGYAAELRSSRGALLERAASLAGQPPVDVFVPNGGLDVFEKLPVAGITNGLSDSCRPERLAELRGAPLRELQARAPAAPLFRHPEVQREMLAGDHDFDASRLEVKAELKRLLQLECFGRVAEGDPPILVVVGRLVEQKHLDLVLDIVEPVLAAVPEARFAVLASAADEGGRVWERAFAALASRHPDRFFYDHRFHLPLSRLMMAGGDFALVPSRFEPCGLVDFEASLLGTVVIARRTGGLAKMQRCGYLYDWLDEGDPAGEARTFAALVVRALETRRDRPWEHRTRLMASMAVDASWDRGADDYLDLYLHGQQSLAWRRARRALCERFIEDLGEDRERFARYFAPAQEPWADILDWELFHRLRP
jgi:glycogen synthase